MKSTEYKSILIFDTISRDQSFAEDQSFVEYSRHGVRRNIFLDRSEFAAARSIFPSITSVAEVSDNGATCYFQLDARTRLSGVFYIRLESGRGNGEQFLDLRATSRRAKRNCIRYVVDGRHLELSLRQAIYNFVTTSTLNLLAKYQRRVVFRIYRPRTMNRSRYVAIFSHRRRRAPLCRELNRTRSLFNFSESSAAFNWRPSM